MALGALVEAGLDGIRNGMRLQPTPAKSIWEMTPEERHAAGIEDLPGSLAEALARCEADEALRASLGPELVSAYLRLRRSEISAVKGESDEAICARYAAAY